MNSIHRTDSFFGSKFPNLRDRPDTEQEGGRGGGEEERAEGGDEAAPGAAAPTEGEPEEPDRAGGEEEADRLRGPQGTGRGTLFSVGLSFTASTGRLDRMFAQEMEGN